MILEGKKINFLGDSITQGAGATNSAELGCVGVFGRQSGVAICRNYGIGGTNDFGYGDAPMGTFADRTPDTFYGACHTLISSLIEKYIGKPSVVLTPLHRSTEDEPNMNGCILSDYVKVLKEVAQYYALPVLDLYAMSGIQPRVPCKR